jgi:hypothetical protein
MSGTAAVIGSSLVSMSAGTGAQDRDDLFNCLLRVDRLAGQVDRQEHFSYWTYRYGTGLEQRGFTRMASIHHQPAVINSASELKSITFDVTRQTASAALARQAIASLEAMQLRGQADRFFTNGSGQSDLARFQVVPCQSGRYGQVSVVVCGIQLTGYADVRDYEFWTQTSRDMVLRISGAVYRFDRDAYALHRERIRQELGDAAQGAVQSFEL